MDRAVVTAVCLGIAVCLAAVAFADDFEAIPATDRELYCFDLEKNFYVSETGFDSDLDRLVKDIEYLEGLKGKVTASPDNLYDAYSVSDRIIPVWWKLWVYAYLRYSTNTGDYLYLDKIEKASGDLESRIQFVKTETQSIDDAALENYFRAKPELRDYAFAIEEARRYIPHTLSLPEEELLATLTPYLGSWSERLYQKCIDRTDFPDIAVGNDTLDVNIHYSALINLNDRDVRKETWLGYFHSMEEHHDLHAFTIVKAIEMRNKLADIKGFKNHPDSRFFGIYLSYDDVADYFDEIAEHAYLRKEYEEVRQKRIKQATGYDTVYIWDRQVQAGDFEKPRLQVRDACKTIKAAMKPLGEEYQEELCYLLDPENRRLDIVGGENRVPGMFATGYPGAPWQFYSMSYTGYLSDVRGLCHEAGHAVHHKLQTNAGVRPIYADGPSYVTEAVAITSELLLGYYMYEQETVLEKKAYYLEQFLEDALGLLLNNMFAHLELKIYEGIEEGTLKEAEDLDALAYEMVTPYSTYYDDYPEYKQVWAIIHHYYDAPMYNVNYVFAQALAVVFLDKLLNEPGFVDRYLSMLRSGFDRPAPEIIQETTGVDMLDPAVLESGFAMLKQKTEELRSLYYELGVY